MFSNSDSGSGIFYSLYYYDVSGAKHIGFDRGINGISENIANSATTLTTGTWYFLVGTYDGTNLRLYLNGSLVAGPTFGGSGTGSSLTNDTDVGTYGSPGGFIFSGKVDEAGVWNRVLTTQEITDLYNGGSGQTMTNATGPSLSSLQQYHSDATTTIASGTITIESTVVFGATLNSGGTSTLQLQAEIQPVGTSFTGAANVTSSYVLPGHNATATIMNLANGDYHWQARVMENGTGATSTWQWLGPSATSTDFTVAVPMSAYFDGSSTWRWPATRLGFNSTDPFTIEFWYKTSSTDPVQLLDTRSDSSGDGFAVFKNSDGINFSLDCDNTSTTLQLSSAKSLSSHVPFNGPVWHHVAVTKAGTVSSTETFKLYFDTVQQTSTKCYVSTSTDSIWIPGSPSSSLPLFKGNMDEVRIWKTERSSSDLQEYYQKEVTSTDNNLLGYWRFNGTSTDLSTGHATSGQIGNPTNSTDTPYGHFTEGYSSVNSSTHMMSWASSTKYLSEWDGAVDTWNAEKVMVTSTVGASDLVTDDIDDGSEPLAGYVSVGSPPDHIFFNEYYLDAASSSIASNKIQMVATHELGHALGLDHSWYGNVMNYYVTPQTSLGPQDKKDYHYLWGD